MDIFEQDPMDELDHLLGASVYVLFEIREPQHVPGLAIHPLRSEHALRELSLDDARIDALHTDRGRAGRCDDGDRHENGSESDGREPVPIWPHARPSKSTIPPSSRDQNGTVSETPPKTERSKSETATLSPFSFSTRSSPCASGMSLGAVLCRPPPRRH
ncbi:MAG: hypothetical protein CL933_09650 [Deltaproteobacteria bacterium]|nr:hypothetical protein [Deltaproteobacteria bacterium]